MNVTLWRGGDSVRRTFLVGSATLPSVSIAIGPRSQLRTSRERGTTTIVVPLEATATSPAGSWRVETSTHFNVSFAVLRAGGEAWSIEEHSAAGVELAVFIYDGDDFDGLHFELSRNASTPMDFNLEAAARQLIGKEIEIGFRYPDVDGFRQRTTHRFIVPPM